jgi:ferrous iron transport protein B
LVFVPQIAILFGITAFLEDSGYMARVVFITDKIMRRFGLSGRSVVPLFSGFACAVPAIMAARTIESKRERLITILITPFISCSARLPVFTVLTALAVPETYLFGFISLQGLVMLGMYTTGALFALASALVLKWLVPKQKGTFFMLELPWFKAPRWQAVFTEAYLKSRTFVFEAGKIILLISLILWFLASYGPGLDMQKAEEQAHQTVVLSKATPQQANVLIATAKLEASYAGVLGHIIEPAIRPLGFDWRIGISLIASFAAREVFVGTMATIHSVGLEADDTASLISRLRSATDSQTGLPSYRPSVAFSLMVFYLLAMQCMSTFSIVRRELDSWPWAIGQLIGMTALAWLCSWLVFMVLD